MRHHKNTILRSVFLLLFGLSVQLISAQTYDVEYKDQSLEQVIRDLRKRTGYEFVYQKQTLADSPKITGHFKKMTLQQILNRIFLEEAEIDYEIVKKNIVLKKSASNNDEEYFKRNVTGVITDENDEPLIGAAVKQQDTGNGALTDVDGAFSMLVEGKSPVVEISFLGYKKQVVKIDKKSPFLMIKMQPDENLLSEVIVTGFQNIKRENAVGAYQTISAKKMDDHFTSDLTSRLEGKVPGLVSYNNGSGKSGEEALTIRGVGSFNARTNPLVVVDGLPIEGSIETVNPYDIASINILKDASAASIYGARASNGVIVITTKRATSEKLSIDFNADLTIMENQSYANRRWANASQYLDVEMANFNYVANNPRLFNDLKGQYSSRPFTTSATGLLLQNKMGLLSDADLNATLSRWRNNDYRKEWRNAMERTQIQQQYNLALRTQGKVLNSSIVLNYSGDNMGRVKENDNAWQITYNGDMNVTKWLDMSFGVNLISERSKTHAGGIGYYTGMNDFLPYLSMYNADGTLADMETEVPLSTPSLSDPDLGLKSESFNLMNEIDHNFNKTRRNNIRSYVHANFKILPELSLSTKFQYEDITYKNENYVEADSYRMRHLYNLATSNGVHNLPEGGMLNSNHANGDYYTFRTQANYGKVFAEKHAVEAIAGFEYRQTHDRTSANTLLGYDDRTQTNMNHLINFYDLNQLESSDLGSFYSPMGYLPGEDNFKTSDLMHRFYSLYANANYTYDSRYAAQFSYRVDKADLFGADPKFRGRPLWSAGASWNMQNESWMKQYEWIDVLKLRASYGLTGNIDQSVSSYLTAAMYVNDINSQKGATLNTPPNDQLRWEKTASWNIGADFSFFNNRLSGSLDWYYKKSSDLLSLTDIDPTTGWNSLTINNGKARNTGVELQLDGEIIEAQSSEDFGLSASFGFSYNNNKILKVDHEPSSGYEALYSMHEGHPINSLYSYRFAGMQTNESGTQAFGWYDAQGNIHTTDVAAGEFAPADVIYSGSLDPKVVMSLTPELTWKNFTLSAMFTFYGGHKMRAATEDWTYGGSLYGYSSLDEPMPSAFTNYWAADDKSNVVANGYLSTNTVGTPDYMDRTVVPADFLKLNHIVLGYNFPKRLCNTLGVGNIRLRAQMNNVATWVRNSMGINPEAVDPISGYALAKPRKSYVMSLSVNF